MPGDAILKLRDAKVWYPVTKGVFRRTIGHVKAVDGISLDIRRCETLGVVGESGCGKTTLGKAIMLLEQITGGSIAADMDGQFRELSSLTTPEKLRYRKMVQMIFQDPYAALNPMKKIYTALEEPLIVQGIRSREEREAILASAMEMVNIPLDYLFKYPHEFSGGQRQRICIARALETAPSVVVCDEAVSALDVSIQAQILNLLRQLQRERHLTYVFIAHDLSVVQYMSDRIAVMYLGKVVELADSTALYENPRHPYTQSLLSAVPLPVLGRRKRRVVLQGDVPSPIDKPSGCPFHERCGKCKEICKTVEPALVDRGGGHLVACHLED